MIRKTTVRHYVSWSILYATAVLAVSTIVSCDDDGLQQGDANYWTSSRGQFTTDLDETTTMFFLDKGDGTATVTFDGSNPRHWKDATNVEVNVDTYKGDVIIPETVKNGNKELAVTAIGDEAFMGCRQLRSVVIPESVKSIGQSAFCTTAVTSDEPLKVIIPSALTMIQSATFAYSRYLNTVVTADNANATGIILPEGISYIGKMAFYGVLGIKSITLNEGLEAIDELAFYGCNNSSLTAITIPSTVKVIGKDAFGGTNKVRTYNVLCIVPPALHGNLFTPATAGSFTGYSIHVPAGCLEAYQEAEGWKEYKDIIIGDL